MKSKRVLLSNIPFSLIAVLSVSLSWGFAQANVDMETSVLRPNYRSLILPGAPSPEIRVEVTLNLAGLTLDQLEVIGELKANGETIAQESYKPPPINPFNFEIDIAADTPAGDYDLVLSLYEAGEMVPTPQTYHLKRLSQEQFTDLTSYIDGYNRFILNGEPFFPLGLYVVQCTNGSYSAQLDEIANSPFDTLMNYAVNQCGTDATDAQILGYLDQLESRNLKLIFYLAQYFDGGQDDIDTITHKVNTFKAHPAVISWYLNDERDLTYLTQLEERYQKIRELDENHPVWSVHWNTSWLLQEAHTTDIVGMDSYPIDNSPITAVSYVADTAMGAGKLLWFVPQIFNWQDYPGEPQAATGRPPTREEMRAMSYLAINHGAKGLIYYSYFNIRDDADYATRWPEIKGIAEEMHQLRGVFLSTHQTNGSDIICDVAQIDYKLMRENNTYYLFAVNTAIDSQRKPLPLNEVTFPMKQSFKAGGIDTLFEDGRRIEVSEVGEVLQFTDDFDEYEVHVYHWQGDADNDGDGFDSVKEWGPDGTDPNYDGDGDGKADSEYANAASGPNHSGQHYVTIAVPNGARLSDCKVLDNPHPSDAPAGRRFPFGFFSFEVEGLENPGDCVEVTLFLPKNTDVTTYYRYGPTPGNSANHWYEFMYDGKTGAEIFQEASQARILLHFCDGMRGDDDLIADGRIVDAGAPAAVIQSGGGGGGGSCFIGAMVADRR